MERLFFFLVNDERPFLKWDREKNCLGIFQLDIHTFAKEKINGYGIYFILGGYTSIALYFRTKIMGLLVFEGLRQLPKLPWR